MKAKKVIGALFLAIGLVFAILGTIKYMITFTETEEQIYTTARIVRIDEEKTGDPEFPTEHKAFVELEVNGKKITAELNTYRSSFYVGKQIDIYYLENDLHTVYEKGSESFFAVFALGGMVFAALGAILFFRKSETEPKCDTSMLD